MRGCTARSAPQCHLRRPAERERFCRPSSRASIPSSTSLTVGRRGSAGRKLAETGAGHPCEQPKTSTTNPPRAVSHCRSTSFRMNLEPRRPACLARGREYQFRRATTQSPRACIDRRGARGQGPASWSARVPAITDSRAACWTAPLSPLTMDTSTARHASG